MLYNRISKNQCSTQRLNRCIFSSSNSSQTPAIRGAWLHVFGGVGKAQAPRCHWQLEHLHLLQGGVQSKTNGGHHA